MFSSRLQTLIADKCSVFLFWVYFQWHIWLNEKANLFRKTVGICWTAFAGPIKAAALRENKSDLICGIVLTGAFNSSYLDSQGKIDCNRLSSSTRPQSQKHFAQQIQFAHNTLKRRKKKTQPSSLYIFFNVSLASLFKSLRLPLIRVFVYMYCKHSIHAKKKCHI